ncbi:MFS transporter [soil metagenome]
MILPLWLLVFTAASQTIIVTPILPIIGAELAVSDALVGWLVSAYAISLAVAALVMGPISDRIGRRRVLLIGAGYLAVVLLAHGFVESFAGLLVARVLAGIGGGMLSGAAVSYVGDYFPYNRRGWATGWVMSGISFGLVFGVPMGRVLAVGLGYKMPFVAFGFVMVAAFAMILTMVPQPNVERSRDGVTVMAMLRTYARLLQTAAARTAAATFFLMYLSLGLLVVYLPQWLTVHFPLEIVLFGNPLRFFGLDVDFIVTLFMVGGVASVFISPIAGTISDRIGKKPMIIGSCLGLALVTASVTFVVVARWAAYPIYIAVMALFAMRMTPLQALVTSLVEARQRGTLMSLAIATGQVGISLGAALGGVLYAGPGYRASTLVSAASILLMAALVWFALPEPTEEKQASALSAAA